jgi:hypothetical protein
VDAALAFLDVLDSREKAGVIWLSLIVGYGTLENWNGVSSSARTTARAFLRWKLLLLFGTAALFCAGVVLAASWLGLWHTSATKETIYWFFTGGFVLIDRAVTRAKPSDPGFYAWLLKQAVRFAILIEFLVNLYVFPFLVELAVVPIILALVMAQVVAASDGSLDAARKPVDWMLGLVGVFLLVHAVVEGITDPSGLLARENLETLLIAPALTLAFIPFLAVWAWIARSEEERLRRRFAARFDTA